jgi:hypothetical protein
MMKYLKYLAPIALFLFFTACGGGGGGGGGSSPPAATSISGTAATGAPVASATIAITGATGGTVTADTGTDGKYTANVTSLTAPYLLKVTSGATTLYSVGNAAGTVNIHPLTDLIIRAWYEAHGTTVDVAFTNPAANANTTPPTTAQVAVIKTVVKNMVDDWLTLLGVDSASFDPITTAFNADGATFDGFLDKIQVTGGTVNVNVDADPDTDYQLTLTGDNTTGYTGVVKQDGDGNGTFTTVSTTVTPLAGAAASPYAGSWLLNYTQTVLGSPSLCGGAVGDTGSIPFIVDSSGNFQIMETLYPDRLMISGTITSGGSLSAVIYGDTIIPGGGPCPAGTITGTFPSTSAGTGTFNQGGDSGDIVFARQTVSAYAGAWFIKATVVAVSTQCGNSGLTAGTEIGAGLIVINANGSFSRLDPIIGVTEVHGQFTEGGASGFAGDTSTMTFMGDSNNPGGGTCPASTSPAAGSFTSLDKGTITINQGGDQFTVELTRVAQPFSGTWLLKHTITAVTDQAACSEAFAARNQLQTDGPMIIDGAGNFTQSDAGISGTVNSAGTVNFTAPGGPGACTGAGTGTGTTSGTSATGTFNFSAGKVSGTWSLTRL